jgi:hypothetical protein
VNGVTVSSPVRGPVPDGVNAIEMAQLVPGAIEKHEINDGKEKSFPLAPVRVSLERERMSSPVFEIVTNMDELCVFTVWLGKLSGDGESDMTGPVTVALKFSVSGPPAERLKTICAVRDPRAVGVKPTLNWHDPPDAVRTVVCTQPEKLWMLKSPAFVPVIVGTLVIVTLEVVPLLIITPIGDTNPVVSETVPKDAALGDSATLLLPVPVRFTSIGLPAGPVKTMCRLAEREAATLGWKLTPMEQVPPKAVTAEKQKFETVKSAGFVPVEVAEVTVRAVAVLFVRVKNCELLAAPRATAPKSKLAGEIVTPLAIA